MRKISKYILLILTLSLFILTGCDEKELGEDTHYKPSEFKHNVAINKASTTIDDVNKEIISIGAETSADIVANTYKESLVKLNEQLTNLENTKKQLSHDKDLTNSELTRWNSDYNNTIQGVKNKIKDVEKKQSDFLK